MARKNHLFAAIDIGSHRLQMKIVELGRGSESRDLENVDLLVPLGRDTFNEGKLSFTSVHSACNAIAGFQRLMSDYRVSECRVVATSALREASNRDYMLDQIRMLTGLDVEVINNSQEKFLTFQAVKQKLIAAEVVKADEGLLLLDIGAGSIQLSLCSSMQLIDSQSMKLGSLRIKEAISKIEQHTLRFSGVLEEYIEAHLENVEELRVKEGVTKFAVVSGESDSIAKLFGKERTDGITVIKRSAFDTLFKRAISMSTSELAKQCGISLTGAEVIAPVLILIKKFFEKTSAGEVMLPHVSLVDGLVAERMQAEKIKSKHSEFEHDILKNAEQLAERYKYSRTHTNYVVTSVLALYDSLKNIHGMKPRDRFLLHVATLLHDIGKFIASDPHYVYSYNIIKASQLPGLADTELAMVANIARFHSAEEPDFWNESLRKLEVKDRLKAVKLIALIRLADSLDTSHRQKLSKLSVDLSEDVCHIRCISRVDASLEQWAFQTKASFFREVFGFQPVLHIVNKAGKADE